MKKSLIAGAGVAALGMAVLPFAGVFAATHSTVTDTVKLTVEKTCKMEAESATKDVNLGTSTVAHAYEEGTGSVMTITCNSLKGWTLKATASALANKTTGYTDKNIPFGAYPETPSASVWSAKIIATGGTVATGWNNYSATTANSTTILSGASVDGITVTPKYKAYAASTQEDGTYEGTIEYVFAENLGA